MKPFYRHTLSHNGINKTLEKPPSDWEDREVSLTRHELYKAVGPVEVVTQRFVKYGTNDEGGYQFIKDRATNPNEIITYKREKRNIYTNDYEPDYEGVLDLSPTSGFEDTPGLYVTVKMIDSSTSRKIYSRDDLELNVFDNTSLEGNSISDMFTQPVNIAFPPVDLFLKGQTSGVVAAFPLPVDKIVIRELESQKYQYVGDINENELGDKLTLRDTLQDPDYLTIYENTNDYDVTLQLKNIDGRYDFNIDYSNGGYGFGTPISSVEFKPLFQLVIRSYNEEGSFIEQITFFDININFTAPVGMGPSHQGKNYSGQLSGEKSIIAKKGGRIEFGLAVFLPTLNANIDGGIAIQRFGGLSSLPAFTITNLDIIEKTDGYEENQIKSHYLYNAFRQILKKITDSNPSDLLQSSILGHPSTIKPYPSPGFLSLNIVTNGYQLRQFTERALNLSLRDLFKAANAETPIGLWYDTVNNYVVIEDIEEFYKDEVMPFTLTNIDNFKKEFSEELYANNLTTGYPKLEFEKFNGLNDVMTETSHSMTFPVKNTIDIRSSYSASSIGMELLRLANKNTETSKDTKNDDVNFIAQTISLSNRKVKQGGHSLEGFEGIEDQYNMDKTPRENLIRHSKVMRSTINYDQSQEIIFAKSKIDTNISYVNQNGKKVNEFDNVAQTEMLTPLMKPFVMKFNGFLTNDQVIEIEKDPHRAIPVLDYEGTIHYGYINNIKYNDYTGKADFDLTEANLNR